MSESAILAAIRAKLNRRRDCRLFRNSSGVFTDPRGHVVRYGIPSTGGGSDLLGWTSITITPEMVGRRVAVLTAIEVKSDTGRTSPKQENFLQVVHAAGGFAGEARTVEEAERICGAMTP